MSNQNRRNIAALAGVAGTIAMAATILTALGSSTDILAQMAASAAGVPILVATFAIVVRIHTEAA